MTRFIAGFAIAVLLFIGIAPAAQADQWVNGYYRSNGTYVNGYWRSNPDGNPYNNYSYPGNTNPYTGKTATGNADTYLANFYGSSGTSYGGTYSTGYTSTCPANSYSDGLGSCKCSYGYVASGGSCIYGSTYCQSKVGLMSTYNSLSNTCECMSGYGLNSSGICVYKDTAPTATLDEVLTGVVAYSNYSCDYFIVQDRTGSYALLEWYGGRSPSEDDLVYGKFNSYGFKNIYTGYSKSRTRVYVEDYLLSASSVVEKYQDKCD